MKAAGSMKPERRMGLEAVLIAAAIAFRIPVGRF
jgi:hypothetical protein